MYGNYAYCPVTMHMLSATMTSVSRVLYKQMILYPKDILQLTVGLLDRINFLFGNILFRAMQ